MIAEETSAARRTLGPFDSCRLGACGLARRAAEPISNLGLDAKNFGRRQDYATVLADPAGKLVIEVAAGRTQEATEGLLADALQPT